MRHALVTLSLASALLAACASTPRAPSSEAAAQFERLKQLAGDWVAVNGTDMAAGGASVSYRVSGGGSTVIETLFPGTPSEMVSVYHTADGQLVMTHYCAVGNQPFMVARPQTQADRLAFECVGGKNVDFSHGLYMQRAEFEFVDAARVNATWSAVKDGKPDHSARFEFVRSWQ